MDAPKPRANHFGMEDAWRVDRFLDVHTVGYEVYGDPAWPVLGSRRRHPGRKNLAEISKGGGARYNGAIDARAGSGEAAGY